MNSSSRLQKVETESDTDKFIKPVRHILFIQFNHLIRLDFLVGSETRHPLWDWPRVLERSVRVFFNWRISHRDRKARPSIHLGDDFLRLSCQVTFESAKF